MVGAVASCTVKGPGTPASGCVDPGIGKGKEKVVGMFAVCGLV